MPVSPKGAAIAQADVQEWARLRLLVAKAQGVHDTTQDAELAARHALEAEVSRCQRFTSRLSATYALKPGDEIQQDGTIVRGPA